MNRKCVLCDYDISVEGFDQKHILQVIFETSDFCTIFRHFVCFMFPVLHSVMFVLYVVLTH